MYYIDSPRGIKWHYEIEGQGQALLFLHGWGVNLRIWRQQIKFFSKSFRVIAIDLPGHGKSSWRKYAMEEIVMDLSYVLHKLGIKNMGVVGSSLGGLFALKLCSVSPHLIKFIVFVGAQPKFSKSADYPYGLEIEKIRKLAGQLETSFPTIIDIFFRSLFTREERATRRFKWIQTFRKTDFVPDKVALLELLDVLEKVDLREDLLKIDIPIQFINGTEDYICQRSLYEDLKEKLPLARFDWFEKCGHFPFLSKPREFNSCLNHFIAQLEI